MVEELAVLTGETQTAAVKNAVAEKLARLKADRDRDRKFKRLREIAQECASRWKESYRCMTQKDFDDMLYDENGLPK